VFVALPVFVLQLHCSCFLYCSCIAVVALQLQLHCSFFLSHSFFLSQISYRIPSSSEKHAIYVHYAPGPLGRLRGTHFEAGKRNGGSRPGGGLDVGLASDPR
jgi:hypothetical protein